LFPLRVYDLLFIAVWTAPAGFGGEFSFNSFHSTKMLQILIILYMLFGDIFECLERWEKMEVCFHLEGRKYVSNGYKPRSDALLTSWYSISQFIDSL
jgi:hypothetical protein